MTMRTVWTEGQAQALDKLHKFCQGDNPFFVLSGSQGTGKSFLSSEIPSMLPYGKLLGSAPTHKAVKVIRGRLPDDECRTIHSFLGLKPKKRERSSELVRSKYYDPTEFVDVSVCALDEAGMAGQALWRYIEKDSKEWKRKYILIGDRYQLPPIGDKDGACFSLDLPDSCKQELTEPCRQAAGNPIIQVATSIRDCIIAKKEPPLKQVLNSEGEGVHVMNFKQWSDKLAEFVSASQFLENPDYCRVIGYKNDTTMHHNLEVRKLLGEDTSLPFNVGDIATANEAWVVGDEVLMTTGEEFKVIGIVARDHPIYPEIGCYKLDLQEMPGNPVYIVKDAREYQSRLSKLTADSIQSGDWRPYYALSEFFADLRPVYSLTAHKSQGSTFENVFIDFRDIYSNRKLWEADRCYYVALTRAKHNVFIWV